MQLVLNRVITFIKNIFTPGTPRALLPNVMTSGTPGVDIGPNRA